MCYQWKGTRISKLKYYLLTFPSGCISWPRIQDPLFTERHHLGLSLIPPMVDNTHSHFLSRLEEAVTLLTQNQSALTSTQSSLHVRTLRFLASTNDSRLPPSTATGQPLVAFSGCSTTTNCLLALLFFRPWRCVFAPSLYGLVFFNI